MENSFPATSATLAISTTCFCSPISRHLEKVRVALGCTLMPSLSESVCQCLKEREKSYPMHTSLFTMQFLYLPISHLPYNYSHSHFYLSVFPFYPYHTSIYQLLYLPVSHARVPEALDEWYVWAERLNLILDHVYDTQTSRILPEKKLKQVTYSL